MESIGTPSHSFLFSYMTRNLSIITSAGSDTGILWSMGDPPQAPHVFMLVLYFLRMVKVDDLLTWYTLAMAQLHSSVSFRLMTLSFCSWVRLFRCLAGSRCGGMLRLGQVAQKNRSKDNKQLEWRQNAGRGWLKWGRNAQWTVTTPADTWQPYVIGWCNPLYDFHCLRYVCSHCVMTNFFV